MIIQVIQTDSNFSITEEVVTLIEVAPFGQPDGITENILTAKGQLITASAAATPVALNPGTNGQILAANSAQVAGLNWVDPPTTQPTVNSQIQINAGYMEAPTTTGAVKTTYESTTYQHKSQMMDFADSGGYLYAVFQITLPSDYNGGSMTARFIWTANSTSTNSVVWGIQGVCVADDESIDANYGTAQTVVDANKSTAYDLNITGETPSITLAGTPAAGEEAQFRIYRNSGDGSDTLAATARLKKVILTYTRTT